MKFPTRWLIAPPLLTLFLLLIMAASQQNFASVAVWVFAVATTGSVSFLIELFFVPLAIHELMTSPSVRTIKNYFSLAIGVIYLLVVLGGIVAFIVTPKN